MDLSIPVVCVYIYIYIYIYIGYLFPLSMSLLTLLFLPFPFWYQLWTFCTLTFGKCELPYSGKVWQGKSLANWLCSSIWWKKVWQINRSANRLFIVSINLDGFSLANHRWFAKFAKLSHYTVPTKTSINYKSGYQGGRNKYHWVPCCLQFQE